VNEFQQSGNHFADWDGTDDEGISVSSGAYFYELQVDHFRAVRKMVMVK
jgi:flagellar hook assembly protein FlgD